MKIKKNITWNKDMFDISLLGDIYAEEHVLEVCKKAYSILLFSENYVFKGFIKKDGIYDFDAIKSEYEWDCGMHFLQPRLFENVDVGKDTISILVMKKLPQTTNILYRTLKKQATHEELIGWAEDILKMSLKYAECKISARQLYMNYIENVQLQLSRLGNILSDSCKFKIRQIIKSDSLRNLFTLFGQNYTAKIIHGNLFLGNMFSYLNDLIVIDPISINHIARMSYVEMDLAAYLTDLQILLEKRDFLFVFNQVTKSMPDYKILLIRFYSLLKLLVRIRFSYIEIGFKTNVHEQTMNNRILRKGTDVLAGMIAEFENENIVNK